jgi:hypothetical protein
MYTRTYSVNEKWEPLTIHTSETAEGEKKNELKFVSEK